MDKSKTSLHIQPSPPSSTSPLPYHLIFLLRHNQHSLYVQKDPVHKNRCHVQFPEVFSSSPYKVNVTAVNALGKASSTLSFEESSIGKMDVFSCFTFNVRSMQLEFSSAFKPVVSKGD